MCRTARGVAMYETTQRRLERQIDILTERNRQLEDLLVPSGVLVRTVWMLTPQEARLFAHLTTRSLATKRSIMSAMYGDRIDDEPHEKIVDVFICKLRRKLKPYDIEITTVWGQGYSLQGRERFVPKSDAFSDLRSKLQLVAGYIGDGNTADAETTITQIIQTLEGSAS